MPLVIEPSPGQLSGDAGLLPIRQFDERIGLTQAFAAALDDPRDPDLTEHSFLEMVRSRVYGILAGYEDQNDHDTLRHDPVFKLVADRSPEDDGLASQPTLSRFENAISIQSLKRLRDVFLDQFIASFDTPPRHSVPCNCIEMDLSSLQLQGEPRRCRWHCAVGKVRYDDVDPHSAPGILVYIKPSLTGDESADILHYAGAHPTFPHESTGNQFYSESQFESYRALGHHIARAVFEQSVADMNEDVRPYGEAPSDGRQRRCRSLFASIVRRWFAMPPDFEMAFVESTHGHIDIQEAFREDKRLGRLTFDLYPELESAPEERDPSTKMENEQERTEREQAELHVITQMLQVMENAWLSLNLDVHYAHPLNRVWMDVFHRWTSAATVRRHWPILRSEFARGFVSFCEKQMRLGVVEGVVIEVNKVKLTPRHMRRLCLEFADQWPEERDLKKRLQEKYAWLVYAKNSYPGQQTTQTDALPYGVIHLTELGEKNRLATYDFFVWIRGAYRNSGLGHTAVRTFLNRLPERLGPNFRLRVRLPVSGLIGPGGKLPARSRPVA
jgi:hypothetical protein